MTNSVADLGDLVEGGVGTQGEVGSGHVIAEEEINFVLTSDNFSQKKLPEKGFTTARSSRIAVPSPTRLLKSCPIAI